MQTLILIVLFVVTMATVLFAIQRLSNFRLWVESIGQERLRNRARLGGATHVR